MLHGVITDAYASIMTRLIQVLKALLPEPSLWLGYIDPLLEYTACLLARLGFHLCTSWPINPLVK